MTKAHKQRCVRRLIMVAMPAIEALPPQDRADAYDGLCIIAKAVDREIAEAAGQVAECLRNAEMLQGQFRDLFKEA